MKRWQEFELTAQDVRVAIKESKRAFLSHCCPIFQMLKRCGIPVRGVGFSKYSIDFEEYRLDETAQFVVHLPMNDWDHLLYACPLPLKVQVGAD